MLLNLKIKFNKQGELSKKKKKNKKKKNKKK